MFGVYDFLASTHASHAWNTGSIPVGVAKDDRKACVFLFFIVFRGMPFLLVHMPLTHCFFRTRVSIPVGATKNDRKAGAFLFLCLGCMPFWVSTHASHSLFFRQGGQKVG